MQNDILDPQQAGSFEWSEQIEKVAEALAQACGEFRSVKKDKNVKVKTKSGAEYSFKYADLDAIMDMIRGPLSKHGLFLTQPVRITNGKCAARTAIVHSSGQWIKWPWVEFETEAGVQEQGGLSTYAKRYSLTGALAITSDEDNDANVVAGNAYDYKEPSKPAQKKVSPTSKPAPSKAAANSTPQHNEAVANIQSFFGESEYVASWRKNVTEKARTEDDFLTARAKLAKLYAEGALSEEEDKQIREIIDEQQKKIDNEYVNQDIEAAATS